jgi:hypothetical protein
MLLVFCVLLGRADDIRFVNGREVDLAPVVKWFRDKKGERPMRHWKRMEVLQLRGKAVGADRCLIRNEEGDELEILISNLSPEVAAAFQLVNQQAATLFALQTHISNFEKNVNRADAVAPMFVAGPIEFVDAAMAQRAQVELAKVNLAEAQERLAELQRRHSVAISNAVDKATVFAMSTGRKLAKTEIWDCGRVRK